ncbi:RNA polymerase I-specific transcription initiation factor RRN3 [Spinellus fusiger]|nr:RNA polymerase I-specific transcription initiation factor RRN3 [Spinellus fusiger]
MDPSHPEAPSTLRLYVWIIVLSQSVSLLDKTCASLVEAALKVDWAVRNRMFVDAYIDLLENLVSAHSIYVVPIVNGLVGGFKFRQRLPAYSVVSRTVVYERNHEAVRSILRLIPTSASSLFVAIVRHTPYHRLSTADQAAYVNSVLEVMDYAPVLQRQILGVLIDHIVQIDAHIQVELDELEEEVEFDTYELNFDNDYASDVSDEEEEDDDDEDDDDESVYSDDGLDHDNANRKAQLRKIKSMVRKLDAMMVLVFRYFAKCATKSTIQVKNEMYTTLIDIFDRMILKTLKCRYTQFLLFYFCSLDVDAYSDHFIEHLIKHITDPLRPGVTRISAAAYISSYIARGKFLEPRTIQQTVAALCTWCEDYVALHDKQLQADVMKHDVFYAVIQAVMYIFCFRWRDLVLDSALDVSIEEETYEDRTATASVDIRIMSAAESGGVVRHWCRGLHNMPHLVMSRLNPLKVCSSTVVKQFAKIAHDTHFMYVYPILEKNKDFLMTGVNAESGSSTNSNNIFQTVQSFFPFDPYKLESSKSFIDNIYFEWIAEDDEDEDEDEEEEDSDEEDDNMSAGFMAMSISPSSSHYMPL